MFLSMIVQIKTIPLPRSVESNLSSVDFNATIYSSKDFNLPVREDVSHLCKIPSAI